MKNFKIFLAIAIAVCLLLAGSATAKGKTGRYYVSGSGYGLETARIMVGTVHHEFKNGFTGDLSPGQVKALEILSAMLGISVEPVKIYSITAPPGACSPWPQCRNDSGGGGGRDTGRQYFPSDQTPWGIERIYNDFAITQTSGGAGVDVAVLDTGVYEGHMDLAQRIEQCADFTHPKKSPWQGKCGDKNGHGTHVAGTILADAGIDNKGIYGIAPEADLFAYRVCDNSGSCWADDIAAAIVYATNQGAEIVSMSLGGDSQSSLIADAIDYAMANNGVLIVAAAGNDGSDLGSIDYPAANVKVMAVGATNFADEVPDWSSRGVNDGNGTIEEKEVEFGAPGVQIESTWLDGKYNTISGTSMAAPHVSGLAARFWQGNAADTRNYLQSIAEDIWTIGDDPATGLGLPHL